MHIHVPAPSREFSSLKPCSRFKTAEIQRIRREWEERNEPEIDAKRVWKEHKNFQHLMTVLDKARINPDCMAFYRPFHLEPTHEWGIYLNADELLKYGRSLDDALQGESVVFSRDVLLSLVLFEVFHHEFFHHIVESAATTLEVLSAAYADPKPIYTIYLWCSDSSPDAATRHPHHPLEEALANAYAYNSLSFISRVKVAFKPIAVHLYQRALCRSWRQDPPGYRDAENYLDEQNVSGAAQLLSMLTDCGSLDPSSAMLISRRVLLNGNSAFFAKPDIPAYIYGTDSAIEELGKLIPAPTETYTNLFWPRDTAGIDKIFGS